jgi:twitching motility protein PilJ
MTTDIRPPYPSEASEANDDAVNANTDLQPIAEDVSSSLSSGPESGSDKDPSRAVSSQMASAQPQPNAHAALPPINEPSQRVYRGVRYTVGGERYAPEKIQVTQSSRSELFQSFYDLPVADKQLAGLLASKILSVAGVIGLSLLLLSMNSRRQLVEQATSELLATAKDLAAAPAGAPLLADEALIAAAESYASTEQRDETLSESARTVLRSTLLAGDLEYVSLVGVDTRVVASGSANRQGDLFNPDNLVSTALREGQPTYATSLVTLSELQQMGINAPESTEEAALVRFGVTPVFAGSNVEKDAIARGKVIGALVTGDIINGDSAAVVSALGQFPQGYSAIYRRDPSGGFARVSIGAAKKVAADGSAQGSADQASAEPDVAQHQFLKDAIAVPVGTVVSERFVDDKGDSYGENPFLALWHNVKELFVSGDRYYTVAATPLVDGDGEPVAVVLRELSEKTIRERRIRNGWLIVGASMLALLADVIISKLLGRSIVKPVRNLQAATEKFASGDRTARAEIFARDEVGRVASAFNELAEAVSTSESSLRFQSATQTESATRSRLLSEFTTQVHQSLDAETIWVTAVDRVRAVFDADRAIIYRFSTGYGGGDVTAESVGKGWTRAKGQHLEDPMLPNSVERFKSGQISSISDIDQADLTDCHCKLLKELDVKANIVGPVIVGNDLVALLCVHQCSAPRQWTPEELDLMQQLTSQVGSALAQSRLLQSQKQVALREQQLTSLVTSIRETSDREKIFRLVTRQIKLAIESSRVIIYTFDEQWNGTIVAESVDPQWPPALGAEITDPCFADRYVEQYKTGRVKATTDIYKSGLTPCHLGQLEPFKVRANLVAPIVVEDRLLGLLIAHECAGPREWSALTINFMRRAATQLGYALEQADITAQKARALAQNEQLFEERVQRQGLIQDQLVTLLSDVEAAAEGDLTVRAEVLAGEIGTVADFFNAIIESLRQIVTQVKQSAHEVNDSLSQNEDAIRSLANEALQQAEQTTITLDSVGEMTASIQQVAQQAQEAAAVARSASQTATLGEEAMDLTVSNILAMRQTVGQTAKKVKRLGESSQQITKAVLLINQISQQTNLLAINAGIEAARAGEAGQGFAAVAEEVGELATRSASATEEIERIVETIQRETNDLVEAIEQSTAQVVEGTRRVEDAKLSLNQILAGSQRMDELARLISEATGSQVETSTTVSTLMAEIAQLSTRTSESSRQVSDALKQTVAIAQNLQNQVATFVVEDK